MIHPISLLFSALLLFNIPSETLPVKEQMDTFLESLSTEQMNKCSFPFTEEVRTDWHFIPMDREGLSLKDMSEEQQTALWSVMKLVLSDEGMTKSMRIIDRERILFELEGAARRDPTKYYFQLYGQTSDSEPWGWRFEGHHLSLHFTVVKDQVFAALPAFLGVNPANHKGDRILVKEEDLARKLIREMSADKQAKAIIDQTAYPDVLSFNHAIVTPLDDQGIRYSELNVAEQNLLEQIIEEYIGLVDAPYDQLRKKRFYKEGREDIVFAWAGSTEVGEGHYYRIQSPTVLIEFDNVQNDANHIHAVWRDFEEDYGRDYLREHYKQHKH